MFDMFGVVWIVLIIAIIVLAVVAFIKKYIKIFPPNIFYVHLRKGKPISQGEGGMVMRIPFFDKILKIDKTVQQLNVNSEHIISKEKQYISLEVVVQWQAVDAISTIFNVKWREIPNLINTIIESVIRTRVANLKVEEVLEERIKIIDAIKKELIEIVKDWGVSIITVEIPNVKVINEEFLRDLSRPRMAEIARNAMVAEIEKEQTTKIKDIERERLTKLKEIEMAKQTGTSEQIKLRQIQEEQKEREKSVLEIEMQKQVLQKKYEKEQAEIEAEKAKNVEMRRAEAEKYRKVTQEAEAEAQRIKLKANAEAEYIKQTMNSRAQGLAQRINALNNYSENALKAELLKILPEIYKNIKIGDVTLFSSDGQTQDGEKGNSNSVYNFFGQMLMPAVLLSKIMGMDSSHLMNNVLSQAVANEIPVNGDKKEVKKKKIEAVQ
ncbi:MAG: SPFH domain-containing protein [Candidatus Helarchaeota archaeon]